jgi:molecular chaperone GrpE
MPDDPTTTTDQAAAGNIPAAEPVVPDEATAGAAYAAQSEAPESAAAELGADAPADGEPAVEAEPDWHDRYLRSAAELDNVRKRARRDAGVAEKRGIAKLARELLPALDNLDRAIAAAEAEEGDTEHHLTKGIRLVQSELVNSLARVGIEAYRPDGELFDPHSHEAIAQQPREGVASGTIVEVYQQGYRLGEDVLRPAKVVVAA